MTEAKKRVVEFARIQDGRPDEGFDVAESQRKRVERVAVPQRESWSDDGAVKRLFHAHTVAGSAMARADGEGDGRVAERDPA